MKPSAQPMDIVRVVEVHVALANHKPLFSPRAYWSLPGVRETKEARTYLKEHARELTPSYQRRQWLKSRHRPLKHLFQQLLEIPEAEVVLGNFLQSNGVEVRP